VNVMLEPDRDQLEIFVEALLRYAGHDGFVSVRSFYEDNNQKFRISPVSMKGGLRFLIEVAEDDARRAAQAPGKVVFCPPLAVFSNKDRAREIDIALGLVLSAECDTRANDAREKLETLIGPATVVVKSGGTWIDPQTGETQDKLHLHWRLQRPAEGTADLARLKQARDLAARLVGGDPSGKSVAHPFRWPGSWHRKGQPKLCAIEAASPDQEIDLAAAAAALAAAAPADDGLFRNSTNQTNNQNPAAWEKLIAGIVSSTNYHDPTVRLAAKFLRSGMSDGAAVNVLRALMSAATGPRDERWQGRYDDISRSVSTARRKLDARNDAEPPEKWRELLRGAGQGTRASATARLADYLLSRCVDPFVALELLRTWNYARCSPPLAESEVTQTVDNVAGRVLQRRLGNG
jgi:hypothetical protein